ncbi:unnamed protein product [Rotaria socialis]|uniref:Protein kinase domain-containing protein n=1 Tax=Rotaria socialis TaxID=392032 RepID=A0A817UIB1_9BILA|nr:unnamed protein product [Rotaria socialis]
MKIKSLNDDDILFIDDPEKYKVAQERTLKEQEEQENISNFIICENCLVPLESLTLIQSQQVLNIIEYLYNCRIIQRDLRPDNLMLDSSQEHLKLIDFGFATTYEIDEMTKQLPIEGAVSYAGVKLLKRYYNLLL